jgi:hypothetical protein
MGHLLYPPSRLVIPAGILRIPVFSVPVHFFSQESRFLFRRDFLEPPEESCLYGAYVESYVGYKFVRQKQSMYNSMTLQWLLSTTIDAPPPPLLAAAFVTAGRGQAQEHASVHPRLPRVAYLEEWHEEEEGGGARDRHCQCR